MRNFSYDLFFKQIKFQMENNQLVIKRIFKAPIELLFNAWIDPLLMEKWFSPETMTTPNVEVDLRTGGKYSITMAYENKTTTTVRGIYKEITAPTKLVFTWKWDDNDLETEVTVLLRSISESKTELVLIQTGFGKEITLEDKNKTYSQSDHNNGWSTAFNKLDRLFS